MTEEEARLKEYRDRKIDWKRWGPYLSERAWGTVREDYSADGSAWSYFPHDHARSKAYRWNEDGLLGICDRGQLLCFGLSLWNGKDDILKERLFGLTGPEGNHGEDVKECYYFLDSTPTHSYMKGLYKYPQAGFPYARLVEENARRGKGDQEFELLDTGVFDESRYFDVFVEYAKADCEDVLVRVSVVNRGPEAAELHVLPSVWFRNRWTWGEERDRMVRPNLSRHGEGVIAIRHDALGNRWLLCEAIGAGPELLFTENETNGRRLYGLDGDNVSPYVKDGINDYVVNGKWGAVNPAGEGTKAAAHYRMTLVAGEAKTIRLRFTPMEPADGLLGEQFDQVFTRRIAEADAFYATIVPHKICDDAKGVMRQALAGMLWSKQFYHYDVRKWLAGDPGFPPPPQRRWHGRNHDWLHLSNDSILSMPDTWEYPWYAAWDLAFHCIPLSLVDPEFAKRQLTLLLREWFMHPNGQLPAYEWQFSDVNPPVHAWAALRVFRIERRRSGHGDYGFLEKVFHKLLINFTWWVNRKDADGRNVFQGGFLGMDNIGLFDRSATLPNGARLDQSDGTSWMAMYCLNMLAIALELARHDPSYEDVATKFLEHFFYIGHAMNDRPGMGQAIAEEDAIDLWDDDEGFYYDVLHMPGRKPFYLRVKSMVGLIPLLAVETMDADLLAKLPSFCRRLEWFLEHRGDLCKDIASVTKQGEAQRRLFSVVNEQRLRKILAKMLDENEFLSPYGIRSLSKYHRDHPVECVLDGKTYRVDYEPAESTTCLFGGNSNWRGPVWFPINYLIIESLQKFHHYFGDAFKVECPTASGTMMTLWEVAAELSRRLIKLFLKDERGRRPAYGGTERLQTDPHFRDLILFHEYFHGDNGAGLGASHQTGWTGLVAKLIQQSGW